MNDQQALAFIHSRHAVGQKVELRNITHLLERLGNPHKQLKFVHVAGTNGKGSTSTYTAAALTKAGYHTGLFISPYVIEFRERIQLDGQIIPKEELAQVTASVKEAVESLDALGERCTEFETVTAIAMVWYSRKQADIVVLEVGLGGRLDATNSIPVPEAAVITRIGLEHTEILVARYMPTSEHSPSKFALRSIMISSGEPWATPTSCSQAHAMPSLSCNLNLEAGTPH